MPPVPTPQALRLPRGCNPKSIAELVLLWELLEHGSPLQVSKDVERDVRSVSILKGGRAVRNIAGNKCLIVVWSKS